MSIDRVRVPSFDDLPLLPIPRVLSPHERARTYRPHQERRRLERRCDRDGLLFGEHPACSACGALAGQHHPIARYLNADGKCPGCAA